VLVAFLSVNVLAALLVAVQLASWWIPWSPRSQFCARPDLMCEEIPVVCLAPVVAPIQGGLVG
jgi:hypothetical protein